MTQTQILFIENNLQMTSREIAQHIGEDHKRVKRYIDRNGLRRTPEQREQIRLRIGATMAGENNPAWRGGISKNNYHYKKLQCERYPERIEARSKVRRAKEKGLLIPKPCRICGSEKNLEAHHHKGYSEENYLQVQWICKPCHMALHNGKLVENRAPDFRNSASAY